MDAKPRIAQGRCKLQIVSVDSIAVFSLSD